MRTSPNRSGFTILELLVVLAMLIILAAFTIPSFSALYGNVKQKAAVDTLRSRIADARAKAMEDGTAYRLAVHSDGTKLRLGPDTVDFATLPASDKPSPSSQVIEQKLDKVTAAVVGEADEAQPVADDSDWVTIATFLPDGTCREDFSLVEIREDGFPAMRLRIRGITGSARPVQPDTGNGGMKP